MNEVPTCEAVGLAVNTFHQPGKSPYFSRHSPQDLDVQTEYNGTTYSFIMVRVES